MIAASSKLKVNVIVNTPSLLPKKEEEVLTYRQEVKTKSKINYLINNSDLPKDLKIIFTKKLTDSTIEETMKYMEEYYDSPSL